MWQLCIVGWCPGMLIADYEKRLVSQEHVQVRFAQDIKALIRVMEELNSRNIQCMVYHKLCTFEQHEIHIEERLVMDPHNKPVGL
jgi:hypothetical protein